MPMKTELKTVMDAVHSCQQACNNCFDACLNEEDIDMVRECIRLDRECADVCSLVLSFSGREGSLRNDLVSLCATICQACGKECEKHEHMQHCQDCAEACFHCAEVCREYVG